MITGMNPKASFGNIPQQAVGYCTSASRDCSTYQFRYATLSQLEFHNKQPLISI